MQNIFGCKLIHSEDAELDFIDWAFTKKLTPDQTATLNIGRLSGRSWRQGVESERALADSRQSAPNQAQYTRVTVN